MPPVLQTTATPVLAVTVCVMGANLFSIKPPRNISFDNYSALKQITPTFILDVTLLLCVRLKCLKNMKNLSLGFN